jgi:lipoate-protein ligase A
MKKIDLTFQTPQENLAFDEALLDRCEEEGGPEVLRFWEAREYFVVLGYSNKFALEVNEISCRKAGIPVFRRASGGGTVLQGPGCLNFSLILRIDGSPERSNVTRTNAWVMEKNRAALQEILQKKVEVRGITDLALGDFKFSGNAQRRKRSAFLFHGTFLTDFDLPRIGACLQMPEKEPDYRKNRPHGAFVTNVQAKPEAVKEALTRAWGARGETEAPTSRMETLRERYADPEWTRRF